MLNKQQLLDRLRDNADQIRECGVSRLELFGSFVRDEAGPDSDADFVVEFEPGQKSYQNFLALSSLLEEVLQRRVEVLTRQSLSPYIGPAILGGAEDVVLGA